MHSTNDEKNALVIIKRASNVLTQLSEFIFIQQLRRVVSTIKRWEGIEEVHISNIVIVRFEMKVIWKFLQFTNQFYDDRASFCDCHILILIISDRKRTAWWQRRLCFFYNVNKQKILKKIHLKMSLKTNFRFLLTWKRRKKPEALNRFIISFAKMRESEIFYHTRNVCLFFFLLFTGCFGAHTFKHLFLIGITRKISSIISAFGWKPVLKSQSM
jgi:hypothetical protein